MGGARWLLCGLLFALTVGLGLATATLRSNNIRLRQQLENDYRSIELRVVEMGRLSALAVDATAPEHLAAQLRELLQREVARRQLEEAREQAPAQAAPPEDPWQ